MLAEAPLLTAGTKGEKREMALETEMGADRPLAQGYPMALRDHCRRIAAASQCLMTGFARDRGKKIGASDGT